MSSPNKIIEILDSIKKLLLEKNRRYGDPALNPRRIFSKLDNKQGILIRLDDKLNRIQNSGELRVNDICDLIGYLVLLLVSMNVTKKDIIKLID